VSNIGSGMVKSSGWRHVGEESSGRQPEARQKKAIEMWKGNENGRRHRKPSAQAKRKKSERRKNWAEE